MKLQRRQLWLLLLLMIGMALYAGLWAYGGDSQNAETSSEIIRFHVIANSDSETDQALKLKVRDAVLETVNEDLVNETMMRHEPEKTLNTVTMDMEETRAYIEENLDSIIAVAESVVTQEGYSYDVAAELGVCWIPEKEYGDATFPAGNYQALNITIGEGKGQNWWCVLFPPLCLIDPQGESLEDVSFVSQGAIEEVPTLKLKFKTKEILDAL